MTNLFSKLIILRGALKRRCFRNIPVLVSSGIGSLIWNSIPWLGLLKQWKFIVKHCGIECRFVKRRPFRGTQHLSFGTTLIGNSNLWGSTNILCGWPIFASADDLRTRPAVIDLPTRTPPSSMLVGIAVSLSWPRAFTKTNSAVSKNGTFATMNQGNYLVVLTKCRIKSVFRLSSSALSLQSDVKSFHSGILQSNKVSLLNRGIFPLIKGSLHHHLIRRQSSHCLAKLFSNIQFHIFDTGDLSCQF